LNTQTDNDTMIASPINEKLKEIYQVKLEEIKSIDISSLPARESALISFSDRIKNNPNLALIAEIKKASPSKGLIRSGFDLDQIIRDYSTIPADAISVLTDQQFFLGHADYLRRVKEKTMIPVLRKDFIISEEQIHESFSMGADIILLIVAMLTLDELKKYLQTANRLGIETMVEVHNSQEIENALAAGAKIIGINNRDLNTFKVDLNNALNLIRYIPDGIVKVAESGMHDNKDIEKVKQAGFDAVLIGEAFMANDDISSAYNHLFKK